MKDLHLTILCAVLAVVLLPLKNTTLAQVPTIPANQTTLFTNEDLLVLKNQVDMAPDDPHLRRQYADVLYEFKRFKEAADNYEIFLQHFQGAPDTIHRYLISIAGYPGDNDRGERATAKYLRYYPSDHELYTRLGYFRLWKGNYQGALEAFKQALEIRPDYFDAQNGVVEAEAALKLNERLARSIPTSPTDSLAMPQLDEMRFRFIQELMHYRRYSAALDELMVLQERHDHTRRWLALYAQIDAELVRITGGTSAYPIDRYSYLLKHQPDNLNIRYALVKEFIDNNRIGEAYETLMVLDHIDPQDSIYGALLSQIDTLKATWLVERIAVVDSAFAADPENVETIAELIDLYQFARRPENTLPLYEQWLAVDSSSVETRYVYTRTLVDTGFFTQACPHVMDLLESEPNNLDYIHLYTRLVLSGHGDAEVAFELLANYLAEHPEDVDALLDLSELHLVNDHPEQADTILRRAFTLGQPEDKNRLYLLDKQISVQLLTLENENRENVLLAAQSLARESKFDAAITTFEAYLDYKGVRTRADLHELATLYSLSGDYVMALSILYELLEKGASSVLLKEVAKNRYYLADHAGAILELNTYLTQYPNDAEARALLQQIYVEVQNFKMADSVLVPVQALSANSTLEAEYKRNVRQRIHLIERSISTDYVGLVVPVSRYTRARGSITSYEYWAQGLLTQVTMPAKPRPFVITAGLISHFLDGNRRLLPDSPFTLSRVNQVTAGAYFDLSEPDPTTSPGYTNRILLEFGVFDYSGGRTAGFGELYYLWHRPGKYNASIGLRNTEGAIMLWSPAGGEFGLRLQQFQANVNTDDILPDSTLRVSARLNLNAVKGAQDSTVTNEGRNQGLDLRLEASYKILRNTYFGLSFNTISYRHTLETYFSPARYRAYDLWLEYENELIGNWYIRSRATAGIAFYRRSSFAMRVEADLIYRFASQFSFSINSSAGYSVRFVDGEEVLRDDRYRLALFSAALYWTL